MIYLESFALPTEDQEWMFHMTNFERQRTCYNNYYPFGVFLEKEIDSLYFKNVTILSGGNGSGKTTLLNLIAEKLGISRYSNFNKSSFFSNFTELCRASVSEDFDEDIRKNSRIITSDDVFKLVMAQRDINDDIDKKRVELLEEYYKARYQDGRFTNLEDSERVKKVLEARSLTASKWIKKRLVKNTQGKSNGESAFIFFKDEIKEDAIYILDEPENSLSAKRQIELVKYIEECTRFFNCQFIISTHSPFISSIEGALIYNLDADPFGEEKYENLENVKLYRDFFNKSK